jgi:hypothetical protein
MSKLVYRICSNCGPSRPVKCNANNPAKSMANHQNRMKCYVSSQDAAVANMTTSVSQVIPESFVAQPPVTTECRNSRRDNSPAKPSRQPPGRHDSCCNSCCDDIKTAVTTCRRDTIVPTDGPWRFSYHPWYTRR